MPERLGPGGLGTKDCGAQGRESSIEGEGVEDEAEEEKGKPDAWNDNDRVFRLESKCEELGGRKRGKEGNSKEHKRGERP